MTIQDILSQNDDKVVLCNPDSVDYLSDRGKHNHTEVIKTDKNGRRLVSIFSGAGGLDIGFSIEGGYNFLYANDVVAAPANSYSHNSGHSILELNTKFVEKVAAPAYFLGDIGKLKFECLDANKLDILSGGPPCQDFSLMRGPDDERQGIIVTRGKLYSHFARALIHLQPKVFVFENVPGLVSANGGEAIKRIKADFTNLTVASEDIGRQVGNGHLGPVENYNLLFSEIVDSADVGVPQHRRRLIIIGIRSDLASSDAEKNQKMSEKIACILKGEDMLFRKYPLTPLEVFEGRPLQELQSKYREIMEKYQSLADTAETVGAKRWKKDSWNPLTLNILDDYVMVNNINDNDSEEMQVAFKEHTALLKELGYYGRNVTTSAFQDVTNMVREDPQCVADRMKHIPPDKGYRFVDGTTWSVKGRGLSLIYRRLHPLKPSYTIVAFGGGGTGGYHYEWARGILSNRERARIQTFPDAYVFKGKPREIRAQIGEAVPPILGRKIAQAVKYVLNNIDEASNMT